MLLEMDELLDLLTQIEPFELFQTNAIVDSAEPIEKKVFLNQYEENLKKIKNDQKGIHTFNYSLAKDITSFEKKVLPNQKIILKQKKPCILVQNHSFFYSTIDHTFHSNAKSEESIDWGVQFSIPQIAQDPNTKEIIDIKMNPIFKTIQKWTRTHTKPTPFLIEAKKMNATFRIGHKCMPWIQKHSQLENLEVCV